MNIEDGLCLTLQLDISSSEPPAPGTYPARQLLGKVAFFTALGIPDNNILGTDIRDIVPRNFKGKQSKDAWSSCGSCHPDGLADGVTWIFGTGPRQTKPLDGMFSKSTNMSDVGILNWSAVRGSNTDFNANSRATQGGCGFASDDTAPGQCFAIGGSDASEPRHLRPRHHPRGQRGPRRADLVDLFCGAGAESAAAQQCGGRGGRSSRTNCASCHGGTKWTKSRDLPPRQPRRRGPERGDLGPRRHQAPAGAAGGRSAGE